MEAVILIFLALYNKKWYILLMTTKEKAIKTLQELPDTVSWADIEERIRFLAAIERGMDDIKAGRVVPHQEVKESLKQWLSK
jgi:predicted transcriptional regulator